MYYLCLVPSSADAVGTHSLWSAAAVAMYLVCVPVYNIILIAWTVVQRTPSKYRSSHSRLLHYPRLRAVGKDPRTSGHQPPELWIL